MGDDKDTYSLLSLFLARKGGHRSELFGHVCNHGMVHCSTSRQRPVIAVQTRPAGGTPSGAMYSSVFTAFTTHTWLADDRHRAGARGPSSVQWFRGEILLLIG